MLARRRVALIKRRENIDGWLSEYAKRSQPIVARMGGVSCNGCKRAVNVRSIGQCMGEPALACVGSRRAPGRSHEQANSRSLARLLVSNHLEQLGHLCVVPYGIPPVSCVIAPTFKKFLDFFKLLQRAFFHAKKSVCVDCTL